MATKYLNTETVVFGSEQISIMYYMEDGLYTFKILHVILEPNGNINKPGGGTSMDTTLDGLNSKSSIAISHLQTSTTVAR